jgi:2-polyprenyl-3-methyl-5-hydroxy-6-metoxy-1,4-benzoquinol methylase
MKIVRSRVDPLIEFVRNKKVLNIGCVGVGEQDTCGSKNWIHGKIAKIAEKLVGIDIQEEEVRNLREQGFDIRLHSADEFFDLGEKFDVVIAHKVINHLYNLKTFLANVDRHLRDDGLFIIASPNPQAFEFFLQTLLFGKPLANPCHTHWQNKMTLKYLLESIGFELIDNFFIEEWPPNFRGKSYQVFFFWLPGRFSRSAIYIARRKSGVNPPNDLEIQSA